MIRAFIALVLFVFVGYGVLEALPLILGPSLSVSVPTGATLASDGIVEIQGIAPRAATLTLNGEPVLREQDGTFSVTRTFPRGGSILTFKATDRFGRTVATTRSIFIP